jgi:hypothetical protein
VRRPGTRRALRQGVTSTIAIRRLRFLSWLCCLTAACDAESGHHTEPELALGTGESHFETVEEGAILPLVAGSQGGHHVWLSMRMAGLDPSTTRMILDVVPAPLAPPAHTDVSLHFDARAAADDGLTHEFVGWPARVLRPECAEGKPVTLSVQLTDGQGRKASASLRVVAGEPDLPFRAACAP